jgi:2'-5' RNA ligase
MKRLFLALELPGEVKVRLARAVEPMRRRVGDVKWVEQENLHVTLKFLGDTPDDQVVEIGKRVAAASSEVPELSLCVGGLGAFPSLRRPRILWASVTGQVSPVGALAARLDRDLAPLGFVPEERPFAAHITVGRVRPGARLPQVEELAARCSQGLELPFTVSHVTLFWSQLARTGPTYVPLDRLPLNPRR